VLKVEDPRGSTRRKKIGGGNLEVGGRKSTWAGSETMERPFQEKRSKGSENAIVTMNRGEGERGGNLGEEELG